MDGQQKYVILQGDSIYVRTDQISQWRDQINAAFGIPKDHVMVMYTHVHNGGDGVAGVEIFPQDLLTTAMANAQPVEVGWFNQDMGTRHNTHRNLFTDATHATSSFSNYLYDPLAGSTVTDVLWTVRRAAATSSAASWTAGRGTRPSRSTSIARWTRTCR